MENNNRNIFDFFKRIREDNSEEFEFEDNLGKKYRCVQLYIGSGKIVYSFLINAPRLYVPLSFSSNSLAPTAVVIAPGNENSMVYLMGEGIPVKNLLLYPILDSPEFPPNVSHIYSAREDLTREWNEKYQPQYWEALEEAELPSYEINDCKRIARKLLVNGEEPVEDKGQYLLSIQDTVDFLCGCITLEDCSKARLSASSNKDRTMKAKQKKVREFYYAGNILTETEVRLADALRKLKEKGADSVTVIFNTGNGSREKKVKIKTLLKYLEDGELFILNGLRLVCFNDITSLRYRDKEIYKK